MASFIQLKPKPKPRDRTEDVQAMRAILLRLVLVATDRRAVGEAAIAVRQRAVAGATVELAFLVAARDVGVLHARQSANCFRPAPSCRSPQALVEHMKETI